MKKQILFIHGGSTFNTDKEYLLHLKNLEIDLDRFRKEGWKDSLRKELGEDYDILLSKMPNPSNAQYKEWEIIFKKTLKLLENNVVLIGHSLGAIFLAKYLSENKSSKKILATFLISSPYNDKGVEGSLDGFVLPKNLNKLNKQGGKFFLYHSQDDSVVPYVHLEGYKKALPNAIIRTFEDRGHFNQSEFPELIKDIKELY